MNNLSISPMPTAFADDLVHSATTLFVEGGGITLSDAVSTFNQGQSDDDNPLTHATASSEPLTQLAVDHAEMAQSEPLPTEQILASSTDATDPTSTCTAADTASTEQRDCVPAVAIQPIYPHGALRFLVLKCPAIRNYLSGDIAAPTPAPLRSGLDRTLELFDGGRDMSLRLNSDSLNVNENHVGHDTNTHYACSKARGDGCSVCPTAGCVLPDGTIADAPTDLLTWDCNLRDVGQATIARSVATSEFGIDMIESNEKVYAYEKGSYSQLPAAVMQKKIFPHLGAKATLRMAAEIGRTMRVAHARHLDEIIPASDYICFNNGTLNVSTRQLEANSPNHILLNRIEHDYIMDAPCPNFIAFLHSIWADDADRDQKIRFMRQWIGYLLVADARMQKMVILKGEGSNGKSVLLDVVRAVVGEANTASANVDRFRMSYVRATLEGKLLNLSADLPKHGAVSDGDLKAIISGDSIEVSPKHKPSYTIKPFARLMVATNNMPQSRDTTDGYFRRLVILGFNRKFGESQQNPNLLTSLLAELPGIVAWAVKGLYDLRNQGRFTIPTSSTTTIQTYREDISPARLFASECLVPSADGRSGFLPKDLFLAFRAWCRDRGFDAENMVTFGRELSALGFNKRKSGLTWWLISAREGGQDYFNPALLIRDECATTAMEPLPSAA